MNLISVNTLLPENAVKQRRWGSSLFLLANNEDYVGLGKLEVTPENKSWRLNTGELLPFEAVTHWSTLMAVSLLTNKIEDTQLIDEDGYPTAYVLALMAKWSWEDPEGWFNLAEKLWHHREYGFGKREVEAGTEFEISTVGWGGNESLIRAMQENFMLWGSTWRSSRVGGHYVFRIDTEPKV